MNEMQLPLIQSLWVTQLVQVTLLAACVWVLVKLFGRRRPHLGHALWLLVLVKCLIPPVMTSPTALFPEINVSEVPYVSRLVRVQIQEELPLPIPIALNEEIGTASTKPIPDDEPVEINRISEMSRGYRIDEEEFREFVEEEESESILQEASHSRIEEASITATTAAVNYQTSSRQATLEPWWTGWLMICGGFLAVTLLRVAFTLRRVKRQSIETPGELAEIVERLSQQFRVRRRVRICVTAAKVGPAVVGWLRPLLILPEVVIANRTTQELEPIIAHELLHIKRGDLGVGWLQILAQSLWWFHPLVWLVNQSLRREAERCCDEAVLAELDCPPAVYARCLLSVLEQKRILTPMPACPGVKPVELTKQRMERIMQLGQGCRSRTPWWCWLIVIGLGLIVLPGRGESEEVADQNPEISQASESEVLFGQGGKSDAGVTGSIVLDNKGDLRPTSVDPEVWDILEKWEQASRHCKSLSGDLRVFFYSMDMELEQRVNGGVYYVSPDKFRIDWERIEIPAGEKSHKLSAQGKPFTLKSAPSTIKIRNGNVIACGRDDDEKEYWQMSLPETISAGTFAEMMTSLRGLGLMGELICGLSVQEVVEKYHLTLLPQTNEGVIWLEILPKRATEKEQVQSSQYILDRKTLLPRAIKIIDSEGKNECVQKFDNLTVNGEVDEELFDIEKTFKDYKRIPLAEEDRAKLTKSSDQDAGVVGSLQFDDLSPTTTDEVKSHRSNAIGSEKADNQLPDPELWKILVQWEEASRSSRWSEFDFKRFIYDSVFQIEKRSKGKLYLAHPVQWRIDIVPLLVNSETTSQKLTSEGKPYSLESDTSEIWIRNGQKLAQAIEQKEKYYQVHTIPGQGERNSFIDWSVFTRLGVLGPVGEFWFGLSAADAVERFQFTLLPQTDKKRVWLKIVPKQKSDKRNWQQSEVILERNTLRPLAVKILNPAGTTETVYSFSDFKIYGNADEELFDIPQVLKDYQFVEPEKVDEPVRECFNNR